MLESKRIENGVHHQRFAKMFVVDPFQGYGLDSRQQRPSNESQVHGVLVHIRRAQAHVQGKQVAFELVGRAIVWIRYAGTQKVSCNRGWWHVTTEVFEEEGAMPIFLTPSAVEVP
jgi:hypothetical protein